ncbi:MAG: hypothetical protein H6948_11730 [Zoogloeaceae bacterium]|nr:hypothetical protein [Zoogloeaceae bacterium]
MLLFMPVTRVLERHWVLRPLCMRRVSGKRLVSLIDRSGSIPGDRPGDLPAEYRSLTDDRA